MIIFFQLRRRTLFKWKKILSCLKSVLVIRKNIQVKQTANLSRTIQRISQRNQFKREVYQKRRRRKRKRKRKSLLLRKKRKPQRRKSSLKYKRLQTVTKLQIINQIYLSREINHLSWKIFSQNSTNFSVKNKKYKGIWPEVRKKNFLYPRRLSNYKQTMPN